MKTDIVIIGGGLGGLSLAEQLSDLGMDWVLLEARDRLGGRILSTDIVGVGNQTSSFDLGPTWIWPENRRMRALAERMGLDLFPQYATGRLVFQDQSGNVRHDFDFSTMAGTLRVDGGVSALIGALASTLPSDRLMPRHSVQGITSTAGSYLVEGVTPDGAFSLQAEKLVLALPPRVVVDRVRFEPALSADQIRALEDIPTWMAAQAKFVAIYEKPFWREQNLSGDGISHFGPLAEIHDASPMNAGLGALFGFVGVPSQGREGRETALTAAALQQLGAMFSDAALKPTSTALLDWATEPHTATEMDRTRSAEHPHGGVPPALRQLEEAMIFFAGTEVAESDAGLLEGAAGAAETVLKKLRAS